MNVLQINSVYGVGSTGKLTQILHTEMLKNGVNSVVLYGRGASSREKNVHRICCDLYGKANSFLTRFTGLRYGGCWASTQVAIRFIRKEKPDVVHLQCINGNFINIYRLVAWLKKQQIPTIVTLHAEFMYTANCGHAFECERWKIGCGQCPRLRQATKSLIFDRTHESFLKMQRAFNGFEALRVVSVSPWLMERAKSSPIFSEYPHCVILNGVDTGVFHCCDTAKLAEQHNASHKKIVFHATAMFRDREGDPKGGWYVLELAKRMPDTVFLVAGKYEVTGAMPENVTLLGEIHDQNLLAQYYSLADLTVITSKRETYSMICAESLCCGTPVAGFCAGAPEQISLPQYSRFVPNGDLDALAACTRELLSSNLDAREIAQAANARYAKEIMVRQYMALYQEVVCGRQK